MSQRKLKQVSGSKSIPGVYIKLGSPEKNNLSCFEYEDASLKKYWGEVTKVETLNYRTYRPEMGGLFCEKIFGPVKNWECACGLHKYKKKEVFFCEVCGVELTEARVRRHRMGYIKLLSPVVHIWYLKGSPSLLSNMLTSPIKELEAVIYNGKEPGQDEDIAKYEEIFLSSFYDTQGEGFHYGKKRQGAEMIYDR